MSNNCVTATIKCAEQSGIDIESKARVPQQLGSNLSKQANKESGLVDEINNIKEFVEKLLNVLGE